MKKYGAESSHSDGALATEESGVDHLARSREGDDTACTPIFPFWLTANS
jgi:hypothetical protein